MAWQYYVRVDIAGEKSESVLTDLMQQTGASRSQILYARKHYVDDRLPQFVSSLDPQVAAEAVEQSHTKGGWSCALPSLITRANLSDWNLSDLHALVHSIGGRSTQESDLHASKLLSAPT